MSIGPERKLVYFLESSIKTPPFTASGRQEVGTRLQELQEGVSLGMPISRPMPSIGSRCHELRIRDSKHNWRIFYRIDDDIILVFMVFAKTTTATPKKFINAAKKRLKAFDAR